MDSSLQVFNNEDFGEIRVLAIDSEPWFVARDVTDALVLDRTATRPPSGPSSRGWRAR